MLTQIYQQDTLTTAYSQRIGNMKGQRALQGTTRVLDEGEPDRFGSMSRADVPIHARQSLCQNHIDVAEQRGAGADRCHKIQVCERPEHCIPLCTDGGVRWVTGNERHLAKAFATA